MRITIFWFILFLRVQALSQNMDFGIATGGSNYSGDLTESMSVSIRQTHSCFAVHGRLELDPLISFRLQYMYLKISGDDKYSTRPGNHLRKLSFESPIHELSLVGQMQFLSLFTERVSRWNPYVQFGISIFTFNPMAEYNGELVDLQPLGTEGQGMPNYEEKYALVNYAFAMGFGLRYYLSNSISLHMEGLIRSTYTDYLDDASTNYVSYEELLVNQGKMAADLGNKIRASTGTKRANPGDKDWFQSAVLGISYHFGSNQKFNRAGFKKYQILCPAF
jgi:hypothetical protein